MPPAAEPNEAPAVGDRVTYQGGEFVCVGVVSAEPSACPFRHLDVRQVPREEGGVFMVPPREESPQSFEEVHLIIGSRCVAYALTPAQIAELVNLGAIPVAGGRVSVAPSLAEVQALAERCKAGDPGAIEEYTHDARLLLESLRPVTAEEIDKRQSIWEEIVKLNESILGSASC